MKKTAADDTFYWCLGSWCAKRNIKLETTRSMQCMLLSARSWTWKPQ